MLLLTGSTALNPNDRPKSPTILLWGRIARLSMLPMTLFETGESCGGASPPCLKASPSARPVARLVFKR